MKQHSTANRVKLLYPARPEGKYLVQEFLIPSSPTVMEKVGELLAGNTRRPPLEVLFNWVSANILYVSDKKQHVMPEYWQFPMETILSKKGDCEDSAFLLASMLLASGAFAPDEVRVALGTVQSNGHAWVEVFTDFVTPGQKSWYVLESTSNEPLKLGLNAFALENAYDTFYEPIYYVYTDGCEQVGDRGLYDGGIVYAGFLRSAWRSAGRFLLRLT